MVREDQAEVTVEFFRNWTPAYVAFTDELHRAAGVMGPPPALIELHGDNTYGAVLTSKRAELIEDALEAVK
ncbi:MAG TPA: hypothetical protein VFQ40_02490 [Actinomycetota bacterium]|nr:hypothetical protein [Actinomycetota bacterium]